MNELSGKCVNVVLAVEMGRGMDFLEHPVRILANFNGRQLESDLVESEECPMFNTELVWETEKKELRKVRSTNAPLRVEMLTVDSNQRKDRVGFVLLNPRSANIIPFDSKLEIPFRWQKLLGVAPDNKSSHPELYLSLTIRDQASTLQGEDPPQADVTFDDQIDTVMEETIGKDGQVIPIRYLPDGFVQIGSDDCSETFLLSINVQVAYNLDLLLPEVLVFNQSREKYFISFKIFGITIKSKPFCRDLHANIPMNEKIVVRILSEYDVLKMYLFQHCQIVVCFFCGNDKLGTTALSVDTFLRDASEEEFRSKMSTTTCEQKCFFRFPSPHGIVPSGSNERQPFIEVATTLQRVESSPKFEEVPMNTDSEKMKARSGTTEPAEDSIQEAGEEKVLGSEVTHERELSPRDDVSILNEEVGGGDEEEVGTQQTEVQSRPVSAAGDQCEFGSIELKELTPRARASQEPSPRARVSQKSTPRKERKVKSAQHLALRPETAKNTCRSTDSVLKNVPPLPSPRTLEKIEDLPSKITLYQQYCLDVILENINLKKQVKSSKFYIKFKHPRASSATVIVSEIENHVGEDIMLENTRCKMYFISTTDHIRKMVYAWPPKLVLADENDQSLTEELDIYTAMFLAKSRTEFSYITELKSLRTFEPLAKISVTMYLQEYGLSALPKPTHFDLVPPLLDEQIALKELQDLQEWKQMQKEQFSTDLKILEKKRLTALQRDWNNRKKELEKKLSSSVARCQSLSQELQEAVNAIRTKKALERKEFEFSSRPNSSFEDDVQKNARKYSECQDATLIETISKLERDNEHLKGIINDQRKEIQQIKKTALTKEQTTSLLQQLRGLEEKFEEARKAKTYFKDQWKKAVREIHDLKAEDHKQIQEKLQSHKIELSQLSLDSYFPASSNSEKFGFASNPFAVRMPPAFGDYKWDDLDFPVITRSGIPSYNCTNDT